MQYCRAAMSAMYLSSPPQVCVPDTFALQGVTGVGVPDTPPFAVMLKQSGAACISLHRLPMSLSELASWTRLF